MATARAVWGIEVGDCALKAIKLRPLEDRKVELLAFDIVEHPKLLSQPDADSDELIHAALEKFTSRNDLQGDAFVIGVPGQQTFSRFCKLPPVEPKKIPDIVRFEATQQIPFDVQDVVWDYQVFQAKGAPDVEVGIFAMRKDLIRKHLDYFGSCGIAPKMIQTIPCALYNFCRFEEGGEPQEKTATVVIDVGAQHTDLIVVEPHSAWSRNIPLGGNNFTEALVKAFKLSFAKAETLKRTAATSKYARQIFQAMRPVFADLVAEVQRSLGFYSSTHRDVELRKVLACGNAFHLPGLQKYLENNLTIAGGVARLEKFDTLITSAAANASQFTDNILSFAPAYGLALQGLELVPIASSLLPPELARIQLWKRKRPYFMAAAACFALAAVFPWARSGMDKSAIAANSDVVSQAKRVVQQAKSYESKFRQASEIPTAEREKIDKLFELHADRDLVPKILALVHEALPEVYPPDLAAVTNPEKLKALIQSNPTYFARVKRRQMIIEKLDVEYSPDIDNLDPGYVTSRSPAGGGYAPPRRGGGGRRPGGWGREEQTSEEEVKEEGGGGFYVSMEGRLLGGVQQSEAVELITEDFYRRLRRLSDEPGLGFYIPEKDPKNPDPRDKANLRRPSVVPYAGPSGKAGPAYAPQRPTPGLGTPQGSADGEAAVAMPDPVTGEDMSKDWSFRLGFKVKLGEAPKEASADTQ